MITYHSDIHDSVGIVYGAGCGCKCEILHMWKCLALGWLGIIYGQRTIPTY